MAVKIIVDTTAGLPPEFIAEHKIPVLPQIIIFGEETYRDDTELDTQTFLKKLRASETLPKTAAPPPVLYTPIYQKLLDEGHTVLVIAPSAEVSGTVRSAEVAAQDFPEADIHVFDSRLVAGPLATMVIRAVEWAEGGLGVKTIKKRLTDMIDLCHIYFVVATLEYLEKGGRIGGASALIGKMLDIKPILTMKDGKVAAFEKQRTHKRALNRLCELIEQDCPKDGKGYLSVMHADALTDAQTLADHFSKTLNLAHVPIYELPPAIVTHAGPGVLAVSVCGSP